MASSLAAQLALVAAKSTNPLDLKAQRIAHSQSLIFESKVAISQDFDTIYEVCYDGFRELSSLDARFTEFDQTIFSQHSKSEDRTEMTAAQNQELDAVLDSFLALVGSKLLLTPAIKAVDWLVRRFRVHEFNMNSLILTFLPYHTTPIFLNLLTILPEDLTPAFKALFPYKRSRINPPRTALVRSAAKNPPFASALNRYVLEASRQRAHHHGLLAFWAGIMTEAASDMLDSARAGRRGVEKQNHEDILIRFLPVLNDGFSMKKVSELVIGCYMITVVFATKAALKDNVIDSLMEAVVGSWTLDTINTGFVCLAVLSQHKEALTLPTKVVRSVLKSDNFMDMLHEVSAHHKTSQLLLGLISGCLRDLEKQDSQRQMSFIMSVFDRALLDEAGNRKAITNILQTATDSSKRGTLSLDMQAGISEIVQKLNSSNNFRSILQAITSESVIDVTALEASLQTVIKTQPALPPIEDVAMEDADDQKEPDVYLDLIQSLAKESLYSSSFLAEPASTVFEKLVQVLTLAAESSEKLEEFSNLPVLGKTYLADKPQYLSFFTKVFAGSHSLRPRAAALKVVAASLKDTNLAIDLQGLLPYIIVALADSSSTIRREAANLVATVVDLQRKAKKEGEPRIWAHDSIYGQKKQAKSIQWLSSRDAQKIVDRVLVSGLEGYVLDPSHINVSIQKALKSSSVSDSTNDSSGNELRKSLRQSLFSFLCSHIVHTPLYGVKFQLLKVVNAVDKVGSLTRTKELTPVLEKWHTLSEKEVAQVCEDEHLPSNELEEEILAIVSPKDKDAESILISTVENAGGSVRRAFVSAAFGRLEQIWNRLGEDRQVSASQKVFDLSFQGNQTIQANAKDVLRNVELPSAVLVLFLETIPTYITTLESHSPSPKKRRTNQNNAVASLPNQAELDEVMQKTTYILELVDSSAPENHPEISEGLFKALAAIHHFKSQIGSGMGYLLSLALGSLLAIVNKLKTSLKPAFDTSVIRTDLVVDCVRTTESPQVQNTALLLVSSLAVIAPEQVLHSVMPIFTFMGSSILKKDDDYSVMVIDQTIHQVVPALVQSLRNQKRDVVAGTSELLLSFTAAFEHMPSHRRQRLFESLVTKLGAEDFLFAVLAMLSNRYGLDKNVSSLMTVLVSSVGPEVQLVTFKKYLTLVGDSLQAKPGIAQVLLGLGNDGAEDKQRVAETLLRSLSYLLSHSSLRLKMATVHSGGSKDAINVIQALFSRILEQVLTMAETAEDVKHLHGAFGDVLASLLGTLSLVDLLNTLEELLKRPNADLQRKVLRLLEHRLRQSSERDGPSQNKVLDFIVVLVGIVQTSQDILLKHSAVACIDRIAEKYGRKNPIKVVDAAQVIASDACIGQNDNRIRIMGTLCLASMAEVLGQEIIPVLPEMLRRSLGLLEGSMADGVSNEELHNAVFSLLSALLVQVPFMLSDNNLDQILQLASKSAAADFSEESVEARRDTLKLIARKVIVKESFGAVERQWALAVLNGPAAVKEALEIVSIAIEKHAKSETVKNVGILSTLFRKAFDLRREQSSATDGTTFDDSELEKIESLVNDIVIKMIYKLNDSSFRPIFTEFVEWATNDLPKSDAHGRLQRLTSFYRFLQTFFGTLKSIVTSYASYIISNVVEVLHSAKPNSKDSKSLWLAAVRTLRSAFENDQDEFWQSPSHLSAVSAPLVSQLARATNASTAAIIISEIVPTIAELAVATDSPDNHKEMNAAIMKYLRPSTSSAGEGGDSPHTRLAALKAEQALTERLGEEWLALLPEMLPYISELMEDEDETVEREVRKWVKDIEAVLGEDLDDMLT